MLHITTCIWIHLHVSRYDEEGHGEWKDHIEEAVEDGNEIKDLM